MGLIETIGLVLGAGGVSSLLTAWITKQSAREQTVHKSEIEFRRDLLLRIENLEKHDVLKSQRIRELEAENRELRSKVADLESKLGQ